MGGPRGSALAPKHWPDSAVDAFIQMCYEYVKAGKLQCSTFKNEEWGKINEELLHITNEDFGVAKLKGKWCRLRITHRIFSELIAHTDVTWDSTTNKVHAPDEVWQHFFNIDKTKYSKFKKHGCPHYETLGKLFGGTTATGVLSNSSTQLPPTSDEERQTDDNFLTKGVHVREGNIDSDENAKPVRSRKEPKINKSDKLKACMTRWSSTMSARNEEREPRQLYLKEKLARLQGKSPGADDTKAINGDPYSMKDCMDILNIIEGLPDEIYAKALRALRDPDFRVQFVLMPEARRRPVLEHL